MTIQVTDLRVESRRDACGIDAPMPRFSWRIESEARGVRQRAWRILAASDPALLAAGKADLWDSGMVSGNSTRFHHYAGRPLDSGRWVHWSVQADCGAGWTSPAASRFLTGVMPGDDWQAAWIGDDAPAAGSPARHLRRVVRLRAAPRLAVVHWCGLGLCELAINGERVDDRVLSPALSDYADRAYYLTRDVSALLTPGDNCLAALLGQGRFATGRTHEKAAEAAAQRPKLILRLDVEFADGSLERFASDGSWRLCDDGPITAQSEFGGETWDARRTLSGWDRRGFNDRSWRPASVLPAPTRALHAQPIPGMVATAAVRPAEIRPAPGGTWVVRLPHYLAGRLRLRLHGLTAGQAVTVRYGERLDERGAISQDSLRSAACTDVYIAAGGEDLRWEPRFTIHGFELAQIEGLAAAPGPGDIEAVPIHDELEAAGTIATGEPLLDRAIALVRCSLLATYRTIPVDSPARDERQGWLGDRNLVAESEACLFDIETLYRKWLLDIRGTQRADGHVSGVAPAHWQVYLASTPWSGAYVAFVDLHWRWYGDPQVVADHYPALCRLMTYFEGLTVDDALPEDAFGDWCVPPEVPEVIHSLDAARTTVAGVVATAFAADQARMLAGLAGVAGDAAGAARWLALAARWRDGLNRQHFDAEHGVYGNGSATANLLPLAFGLVPDHERARVLEHALDRIHTPEGAVQPCGMVGAKVLLRTLSACGRCDDALAVATGETYPGWGYMARHGATALWELANGRCGDPAMNSGAQPMNAGDLAAWAFGDLAGIRPAAPGFAALELRPTLPACLDHLEAERLTPAGRVRLAWERRDGRLRCTVTIPANTSASLHLPCRSPALVRESARPAAGSPGIDGVSAVDDGVVIALGSGTYDFDLPLAAPPPAPRLPPVEILGGGDHPWRRRVPVALTCADPQAEIRFTTDGSDPGPQASRYTGPLLIEASACVRARAFRPGFAPGSRTQALVDPYDPDRNGAHYRYYELPGTQTARLPDYDTLAPAARGRHPGFDVHRISWQIGRRREFFGVSFQAVLSVPHAGTWTFFLRSHNSSRLWIDGRELVDNHDLTMWGDRSGRCVLAAGDHLLRVDYLQLTNDFGLIVSWQGPGTPFQHVPVGRLRFLDQPTDPP